jgi:hypothetical protein
VRSCYFMLLKVRSISVSFVMLDQVVMLFQVSSGYVMSGYVMFF